MMRWRVVHFIKEDTVEAVPTLWLEDETRCFWPPYNGLKLINAIGKCEVPDENWNIYEVRTIGTSLYDSLQKARIKALQAETTSDINSDFDGPRKIKKKKNLYPDESSEDTASENEGSYIDCVLPEEPPISKKKPVSVGISIGETSSTQCMKKQLFVARLDSNRKDITPTSQRILSRDNLRESDASIPCHSAQTQSSSTSFSLPSVTPTTASDDNTFRKQVLRHLTIITLKLNQLSEDVAALHKQESNEFVELEESFFEKFEFPLPSEEELQRFENFISSDENLHKTIAECAKIGGKDAKIMTKRLMYRLFTDSLGESYSWVGFKKKKNFSILRVSKVIIAAVQKIHKNETQSKVEECIKAWLVKSKERRSKINKN